MLNGISLCGYFDKKQSSGNDLIDFFSSASPLGCSLCLCVHTFYQVVSRIKLFRRFLYIILFFCSCLYHHFSHTMCAVFFFVMAKGLLHTHRLEAIKRTVFVLLLALFVVVAVVSLPAVVE